MWTVIHPSDTQKEAVFCMALRLVDIVCELISISLFVETDWTKRDLCLMLQNAT